MVKLTMRTRVNGPHAGYYSSFLGGIAPFLKQKLIEIFVFTFIIIVDCTE
jgi:hypothetical protein